MSYKNVKSFRPGDPCPLSHQPKVLSKAYIRTGPEEDCSTERKRGSSARGSASVRIYAALRIFRAVRAGRDHKAESLHKLVTIIL